MPPLTTTANDDDSLGFILDYITIIAIINKVTIASDIIGAKESIESVHSFIHSYEHLSSFIIAT